MKAKLEFTLPEEEEEYNTALNGHKWKYLLWDFDQCFLREIIKYGHNKYSEEQINTFQVVRDKIYELMSEKGISFD